MSEPNNVDDGDLKPLFATWLQEAAIEATKKGSKMALLYNKAFDSVRRHPEPVKDPKTLKSIRFVGDKTVVFLTKKLKTHYQQSNLELPPGFAAPPPVEIGDKRKDSESQENGPPAKKPRKTKPYVPKYRSGGYAILLALYIRDRKRNGLTREEISKVAAPYSDKSFSKNPAANDFYSAWNSVKVLMNHELVDSSGRSPKLYFLTDEGIELAKQLKDTEGINSSPVSASVDMSYDNDVRVTPDSTFNSNSYNLHETQLISSEGSRKSLLQRMEDISELRENPTQEEPISEHSVQKDSVQVDNNSEHDVNQRIYFGTKYDVWTSSEYEVVMLIDSREIRSQSERDFFSRRLSSLGVKCEVRALSVGDIVWIAKHLKTGKEVVLNYICERKRIDDLAFSIRDGRFQEQKNRLKKSGMKHFYYLVEEIKMGALERVSEMANSIQTAISMTMTVSDFYLKKFREIDETVSFLASLTEVMTAQLKENDTKLIVIRARSLKNQSEYTELIVKFREKFEKRKTSYECVHLFSVFQELMGKTGMMTVREMFVLMLMAIRGVSLERAIVIQKRFPTPKSLIEYYHVEHGEASEIEKKQLLVKEFEEEIGNKRIGRVCSERIYEIWGQK
ncbi:uncharacterized protein RJT20DRAFT_126333 [Scheffersomyces xylosifermentans]|uniref:uncharacterized protein n=1 Tax=Scheffersomyces xylosifermentans TaxID=1304137 RepID=UPI00315C7391